MQIISVLSLVMRIQSILIHSNEICEIWTVVIAWAVHLISPRPCNVSDSLIVPRWSYTSNALPPPDLHQFHWSITLLSRSKIPMQILDATKPSRSPYLSYYGVHCYWWTSLRMCMCLLLPVTQWPGCSNFWTGRHPIYFVCALVRHSQ